MDISLSTASLQVLTAFGLYLIGVIALGIFSHRYLTRGSFVKEYFLGNRGLGPWVLALTIAATAVSGGTFMGFPSLIYTNGWVMALWICSYMVVPLTSMVLMGKRINQVGRIAGAVTIPDVFRDRFQSPMLGILASLMILLFLCFNLVAQFKAGGLVMKEALQLPPAQATFVDARPDTAKNLVLRFQLAGGGEDVMKTPLPTATAVFSRAELRDNGQEMEVYFRVDGQELPPKLVRLPPQRISVPFLSTPVDLGYLVGLFVFAVTVVGYTTYGGFWAVTWTDVLQGIVMLAGVGIMAFLAINAVPAYNEQTGLAAATARLADLTPPGGAKGSLVHGPGPSMFLPLGAAFSFFCMWSLASAGQPSGMVRLMSFRDTQSLRRAVILVGFYYILTYVSLLIIFTCARAMYPTEYLREVGTEGQPDSIMPAMARRLAHPLVAGFLLAAPYAAIMSTVAAFLLMISSSLVRDLYQRVINPNAPSQSVQRLSYLVTALAGAGVMLASINPPDFLQYLIVFTGSGQASVFLAPMVLTLYWRGATRQGILSGMLGGFVVLIALYLFGWIDNRCQIAVRNYEAAVAQQVSGAVEPTTARWLDEKLNWLPSWGTRRVDAFAPLAPFDIDPLIWGILASLIVSLTVSALTRPDPELVRKYFPESA